MSEWISVKNRLPARTGIYITHSSNEDRDYSQNLEDRICMFFHENINTGKSLWQGCEGFYDNGIHYWLEVTPPKE